MTPISQKRRTVVSMRQITQRLRQQPIWLFTAVVLAVVLAYLFTRASTSQTKEDAEAAALKSGTDTLIVLDSISARLAGIVVLSVTPNASTVLTANGTFTYDADRVSVLSSRVDAHIVAVRADLGQSVPAGGLLAVLESPDVGQTRGELERARANVEIARRNYEREERLFREQISPQKEMLEAEAAYRAAEADYRSAAAKLRAVGAYTGQGGVFDLRSPIGGTIVERHASPGLTVGPSTNLFTVADLRNLWITVDVYEGDLARVQTGAAATVLPAALTGETFLGRVTYAGGVVDAASRTFKVRVEVANANSRLRPGMFAQVRITAPNTGPAGGVISVPEVAVQEVDGRKVVFLAAQRPWSYVTRAVQTGVATGDGQVVITSGLAGGERLVVKGAFQLKAELTKATFGGGG